MTKNFKNLNYNEKLDFRFDFGNFSVDNIQELFRNHIVSIVTLPMYVISFILHLITSNVDDKLILIHYSQKINNVSIRFIELFMWVDI